MAHARICAKFGLQHNCPGRALVSLLSGEAALFQTGGLGGLTIVPPRNGACSILARSRYAIAGGV